MATRELTTKERRIVRRTFRQCTFSWPSTFVRPKVVAEQMSKFGYYNYLTNTIHINEMILRWAAQGDKTRKRQVKSTYLHELFHALDFQCFTNEDRRRLAGSVHGELHPTAPPDEKFPWFHARDEAAWSTHGHAWWDSNYAESLMEVTADLFVQSFSSLTSQTSGRWTHNITPEIEERFKQTLLAVTTE